VTRLLLAATALAALAGCQDIRELVVVTYVVGDGCRAVRGVQDASNGSGNGAIDVSVPAQHGAGAGSMALALERALASRVECDR